MLGDMDTRPPHCPTAICTVLAASVCAAAGCAGPLNQEVGIGNQGRSWGNSVYTPSTVTQAAIPVPEEGFEPTTDQLGSPVYGARGPMAPDAAAPSLVAMDRENWVGTRIDVPNDMPAHQPRMATNFLFREGNPRVEGKYPDQRTAFGVATERHSDEQILEALAAPFVAGMDVVLIPVRAVAEMRPQRPTRTGSDPYARLPGQVTIVNDPLGAAGSPRPVVAPRPAAMPPARGSAPSTRPGLGSVPGAIQPPTEDLKPGGGMPASDVPGSSEPAPK